MAKKKIKVNTELISLFYITSSVLILLLSMLNLTSKSSTSQVLGVTAVYDYTKIENEKMFWEKVVAKTPTYYDGWIELYNIYLALGDGPHAQTALEIAKSIDFTR